MRRCIAIGTLLILGMLGLGLPAQAQEGEMWGSGSFRHGPHRMGRRLMAMLENDRVRAELGLTDQQVDRLRQIMVDTEKASVRTRADLAVRGIELRELLRADKPDRGVVLKKVEEISDLGRAMMTQYVDALLSAKTALTPEQQKKIRTFIETRAAGGPMRERFMGRPPGVPRRPTPPPEVPRNPNEPPMK